MVVGQGSQEPRSVLIVDRDPAARRLLAGALVAQKCRGHETEWLAEAIVHLRVNRCAAAIVALDPGNDAAETVATLRRSGLIGPIFALSGQGSVAAAVEAIRAGADDFFVKPVNAVELARRLVARLDEEMTITAPASESADRFEGFIGGSPVMQAIYARIRRIAPSRAPVFITGESGTGKEVAADAIHARSDRSRQSLIALNCSAIPRELMESEIFGHVKGAFTGAHEDRAGAAEHADGGTLFLDEICDMDLALQAKLLRFIQTGVMRRVGDTRERAVDLRFVCATNRNPAHEIEKRRFREDLFYRLHVLPLHLPLLSERGDDIVLIARALIARFAEEEGRGFRGFAPDAEAALAGFAWPGNVRQLQNVLRRVVVLHDGEYVSADMLALPSANGEHPAATHEPARDTGPLPRAIAPFWVEEQRIIEAALAAFGGNTQRAAAALGISPSTIYRKRQTWAGRANA
jgi:two-component system repressor protein LuxO